MSNGQPSDRYSSPFLMRLSGDDEIEIATGKFRKWYLVLPS
jgi:hypothetical protein